jgi:hypothetical protein
MKAGMVCNFFRWHASKEMINQVTSMKINESSIDSVIRIFAGVLLLYLGFGGELFGVPAVIADILGVILLLTGVIGFCPLYALPRFKSRRKES